MAGTLPDRNTQAGVQKAGDMPGQGQEPALPSGRRTNLCVLLWADYFPV